MKWILVNKRLPETKMDGKPFLTWNSEGAYDIRHFHIKGKGFDWPDNAYKTIHWYEGNLPKPPK